MGAAGAMGAHGASSSAARDGPPPSYKVRLCELLLSIPLAALIVSVSWFGFMGDHFERIAAQDGHVAIGGLKAGAQGGARAKPMAAGFAGAEHPASAAQDASATQAGAGSGAAAGLPRVVELLAREAASPLASQAGAPERLTSAAEAFMAKNSTRMRFPDLLQALGVEGPALEVGYGAAAGQYAQVVLEAWNTTKYVIVDPSSNAASATVPKALGAYYAAGRVQVLYEYASETAASFPDDYFAFVFINPTNSFQGMRRDLKDWWPKIKPGGLFAGKDYCASNKEKSLPSETPEMSLMKRPWCGTYHGGRKNHKEKAGFGRYTVRAVDAFALELGHERLRFTLEGRDESDPFTSDGRFNPSWYMFK